VSLGVTKRGLWKDITLGEILNEVDVRASDLSEEECKRANVLSLTKNFGLIPQTERFEKRIATLDVSKYKVVRNGWFVYNPYVLWEGAIHSLRNADIGLVSPVYHVWKSNGECSGGFIDYLLRTPKMLNLYLKVAQGTVKRRRAVKTSSFKQLTVSLPSLSEQMAIAYALNALRDAIEARQRELGLERERKAALMDYLFTHGTRSERKKVTELRDVPESWELYRFADVVEIKKGQVDPRTEPFASMQNVGPENIESKTGRLLPTKTAQESKLISGKYLFTHEDVLYSKIRPYLRKAALAPCTGVCSADMYPLRPKGDTLVRDYLFHYLLTNEFTDAAISFQTRTGIPKINREQLGTILVPVPPRQEQQEIAIALNACHRKSTDIESEISLQKELFEALLDELTTGRLSALPLVEEPEFQ
jgi:type I restriction enzyme S subunit